MPTKKVAVLVEPKPDPFAISGIQTQTMLVGLRAALAMAITCEKMATRDQRTDRVAFYSGQGDGLRQAVVFVLAAAGLSQGDLSTSMVHLYTDAKREGQRNYDDWTESGFTPPLYS